MATPLVASITDLRDAHDVLVMAYVDRVAKKHLLFSHHDQRSTMTPPAAALAAIGGSALGRAHLFGTQDYYIIEHPLGELWLHFHQGDDGIWNVHRMAASHSGEALGRLLELLNAALPEMRPVDEDRVRVAFWASNHRHGPVQRHRRIASHRWAEIRGNYTAALRERLDDLMRMERPRGAGQLILFRGEPGVGKTHAIRALIREWAHWCDAHYVCDVERFFGQADYMVSVILDTGYSLLARLEDDDDDDAARKHDQKWQLLIAEDADEFLGVDAKSQSGQSVARLLNVADGMIGQGLHLLILLTANEPGAKIHKAIVRPGRCLANLEFPPLTADEAMVWLRDRGASDAVVTGPRTISQLYATLRGDPFPEPPTIGIRS
jgi:Domain of unknown function (DUF5925)/ATPase family associated with various cellular activities (AAA)